MRAAALVIAACGAASAVGVATARAEALGARDVIAGEDVREGVRLGRQPRPASGVTALAESRVIYLNRRGVTLRPGDNDARTDHSSLVRAPVVVPRWKASEAVWADTASCVQQLFAPFDVIVTDEDPGDVPHVEAVFAATPKQIGLPAGFGGVSPFAVDCGVIESSIVFLFTSAFANDAEAMCEVLAQEIAHSYGLDHELLPADPMSYLAYDGERAFQDRAMPCGEFEARPCGIAGVECRASQNSYQLLRERLGEGDGIVDDPIAAADEPGPLGCAAGHGAGLALALIIPLARRRRR